MKIQSFKDSQKSVAKFTLGAFVLFLFIAIMCGYGASALDVTSAVKKIQGAVLAIIALATAIGAFVTLVMACFALYEAWFYTEVVQNLRVRTSEYCPGKDLVGKHEILAVNGTVNITFEGLDRVYSFPWDRSEQAKLPAPGTILTVRFFGPFGKPAESYRLESSVASPTPASAAPTEAQPALA